MLRIVHDLNYVKVFTLFTSKKSEIIASKGKTFVPLNVNFGENQSKNQKEISVLSNAVLSPR